LYGLANAILKYGRSVPGRSRDCSADKSSGARASILAGVCAVACGVEVDGVEAGGVD
jgi:hypothetical protein